MDVVNVHEAKTHLSRLLDRVEQGEEVVIARAGKPVAQLVPIRPVERTPGRLRGRIRIAADFDEPLPAEVQAAFDGNPGTQAAFDGDPGTQAAFDGDPGTGSGS